MADNIELEGEQYFFAHKGEYVNPYPLNSNEFNLFERGWTQALKKSSVGLVSRPPSSTEFPILKNPATTSSQLTENQAELYRSRKG